MNRHDVYAHYRRNSADFVRWEREENERQKRVVAEAIAAMHRREKRAIKLPRWIPIAGIIALAFVVSWIFLVLALS